MEASLQTPEQKSCFWWHCSLAYTAQKLEVTNALGVVNTDLLSEAIGVCERYLETCHDEPSQAECWKGRELIPAADRQNILVIYNRTEDVLQRGALVGMVYAGRVILPLLNYRQGL